jgi:hypothetical protein
MQTAASGLLLNAGRHRGLEPGRVRGRKAAKHANGIGPGRVRRNDDALARRVAVTYAGRLGGVPTTRTDSEFPGHSLSVCPTAGPHSLRVGPLQWRAVWPPFRLAGSAGFARPDPSRVDPNPGWTLTSRALTRMLTGPGPGPDRVRD